MMGYEAFRVMAGDKSLTPEEKSGWRASDRAGREPLIMMDIRRKLTNLDADHQKVIDIGPGCTTLPRLLIEHCRYQHHLTLIDSAEVLAQLPDARFISKIAGRFPQDCGDFLAKNRYSADAVLVYSVFQYVNAEANPFAFIEGAVGLLRPGGQLLIGDIPNASMRSRMAGKSIPQQPLDLDDEMVLGIVAHCRKLGLHAFVVPQADGLPLANRREDILIIRPNLSGNQQEMK